MPEDTDRGASMREMSALRIRRRSRSNSRFDRYTCISLKRGTLEIYPRFLSVTVFQLHHLPRDTFLFYSLRISSASMDIRTLIYIDLNIYLCLNVRLVKEVIYHWIHCTDWLIAPTGERQMSKVSGNYIPIEVIEHINLSNMYISYIYILLYYRTTFKIYMNKSSFENLWFKNHWNHNFFIYLAFLKCEIYRIMRHVIHFQKMNYVSISQKRGIHKKI